MFFFFIQTCEKDIDNFNENNNAKNLNKKEEKVLTLKTADIPVKSRQKVYGFESKIFPIGKQTQGKRIKILTSKQLHINLYL